IFHVPFLIIVGIRYTREIIGSAATDGEELFWQSRKICDGGSTPRSNPESLVVHLSVFARGPIPLLVARKAAGRHRARGRVPASSRCRRMDVGGRRRAD